MNIKDIDIITLRSALEHGYKRYFTGKPCKNGHVSERITSTRTCVMCKNIRERDVSKTDSFKKRLNNRRRVRYSEDIGYAEKIKKINRGNNNIRKKSIKERRKVDILYLISDRCRARINKALKTKNIIKDKRTKDMLGCSIEYMKIHIEKQFLKGMSWDNRSLWHIDHIVPISSAKNENDVIMLNHFTNLRPLWAKDNLSKGGKMEFLI